MILFEKLLANVAKKPKFVHFEDEFIKNICVTKWGEEGRLSIERAAQIKELGTDFKGKTFGNFKELMLFSSLNGNEMTRTLDENISAFMGSNFDTIQLPEGLKVIPHSMFSKSVGKQVIIPASVMSCSELVFNNAIIDKLVIMGDNLLEAARYWSLLDMKTKGIYVQAHLVEEYKKTTPWSNYAKFIYPLNELSRL